MTTSTMDKWIEAQQLEPKVVAVDSHFTGDGWAYEYVFESEEYVLIQHYGAKPHLTIEDHWTDEVLAYTEESFDFDHVQCAEALLKTAKGSKYVRKSTVEKIISKLMFGDLKLESPY